jgi:FkbM family methyltransferase
VVLQKLADKRSNVHFRPVAVSDAAGTAEMQVPRHRNRLVTAQSSLAHGFAEQAQVSVETIRVPTVRLDDEIDADKRIDLAKIDVEGHELPVLRGAASLLRTWMPPILIEIEQRHLAVCRSKPPLRSFKILAIISIISMARNCGPSISSTSNAISCRSLLRINFSHSACRITMSATSVLCHLRASRHLNG